MSYLNKFLFATYNFRKRWGLLTSYERNRIRTNEVITAYDTVNRVRITTRQAIADEAANRQDAV